MTLKTPPRPPGLIMLMAVVALLTGCATVTDRPSVATPASPASVTSLDPRAVHFAGVQQVLFGDRKADLSRKGHLDTQVEGCTPQLATARELSPIFDGERLVLIWVNPPYHTPEGVTVGTALDEAQRRYPTAQALTPPPGSYVFPGLLVTNGDRAYLFLHDGRTVQKTIVGFVEHARRLYEHGVGQC